MRLKYTRILKLVGLIVFMYFLISFLFDNSPNKTKQPDAESIIEAVLNDKKLGKPKKPEKVLVNDAPEETVFKTGVLGNYEPVVEKRTGPGENGAGVSLDALEQSGAQRLIGEFGFNMVASDKISLDRRIKDTRPAECKYWHYPTKLPTASVVIVFHNEGWSTLIRTVHSAINNSPPELLSDIVLIDDYSNKDHLKQKLDDYVKRWNGKVVVYHTEKRLGLVQARQYGAEKIKGDVIIILDAHCECSTNWLPPLLARIKLNRKTLAIPIVDGLDWNTLEHQDIYGGGLNRGIWEWGFLYKETNVPQQELSKRSHSSEPYWSPTHAGGLLAIEKNWFFELGGYDPGIQIWGGEQYELSYKVWQCGGVVEWIPCSHVAHIYRGPRTESQHPPGANPMQSHINHIRVAKVWMDEYAKYYFIRNPYHQKLDYGDISKQLEVREKLQCKPFKWFMDNIAYDQLQKFPLPPDNKVWGECRNTKHQVCLNQLGAGFGQKIGVSNCQHWNGEVFQLNLEGQIASGEHCFISDHDMVKKKFCLDYQGIWNPVGEWKYETDKKQIYSTKEKKCLSTDGKDLSLVECKDNDPSQEWVWKEVFYN